MGKNDLEAVDLWLCRYAEKPSTQRSYRKEYLHLKCILDLLVASGIRLEELANARHNDLRLESPPDLPVIWILTVTGKRNNTREVPLNPDVARLIGLHGGDFLEEDLARESQADLPLIRTLQA